MSRRLVVCMIVVELASAGCGGGSGHERVAPTHERVAADRVEPGRVAASWSTPLDGEPGAVVADAHGVFVTVGDRAVVALGDRGEMLWSAPLDGASLGWPVLTPDLVIVPTTRLDGSGGCAAVDRTTGATRWSYEAAGSGGVAVGIAGTLAICAMRNGVVAGIALGPGLVHWEVALAPTRPRAQVAVSDRTALAVDATTGTFAFTSRVGHRWLLALRSVDTGADRGAVDLGTAGPPSAPVSVGPGSLGVGAADPGALCVVDLRKRTVRSIAVRAPSGFDPASVPLVSGNVVVVAARGGEVIAVDLSTRRQRWSALVPNPILDAHPVVLGDAVLLADWTRRVFAFGLANGAPVSLPDPPGWVIATASDPTRARHHAAVEVAGRSLDGGRIERWESAR